MRVERDKRKVTLRDGFVLDVVGTVKHMSDIRKNQLHCYEDCTFNLE